MGRPPSGEVVTPVKSPRRGESKGWQTGRTQSRSIGPLSMSLRAQRSNLPSRGLRLLRRCAPRNDINGICPATLRLPWGGKPVSLISLRKGDVHRICRAALAVFSRAWCPPNLLIVCQKLHEKRPDFTHYRFWSHAKFSVYLVLGIGKQRSTFDCGGHLATGSHHSCWRAIIEAVDVLFFAFPEHEDTARARAFIGV